MGIDWVGHLMGATLCLAMLLALWAILADLSREAQWKGLVERYATRPYVRRVERAFRVGVVSRSELFVRRWLCFWRWS